MSKFKVSPARVTQSQEDRVSGTIVKMMPEKGFGFIKDDSGIEYFFHRSAIQDLQWEHVMLQSRVTFTVQDNPKGPRAESIEIV